MLHDGTFQYCQSVDCSEAQAGLKAFREEYDSLQSTIATLVEACEKAERGIQEYGAYIREFCPNAPYHFLKAEEGFIAIQAALAAAKKEDA